MVLVGLIALRYRAGFSDSIDTAKCSEIIGESLDIVD